MKQVFFFVGWTVLIAGCGRTMLYVTARLDVAAEGKALAIDPIQSEQKVKVIVTATGGPVHVIVCREEDRDAVETELLSGKLKTPVLAHQLNTQQANLEATVPAKTKAMVLFHLAGAKPARVDVKITNR